MAGIPLNTFKSVRKIVPSASLLMQVPPTPYNNTNPYFLYQAPQGVTSIIIMMQVSNIDTVATAIHQVTLWHRQYRTQQFTTLVRNYQIPAQDAASLLTGRLVLETGDQLYIGSTTTSTNLQMLTSIIETANQ
jgi:hypothetical protein